MPNFFFGWTFYGYIFAFFEFLRGSVLEEEHPPKAPRTSMFFNFLFFILIVPALAYFIILVASVYKRLFWDLLAILFVSGVRDLHAKKITSRSVFLEPSFRGQGFSQKMYDFALQFANSLGLDLYSDIDQSDSGKRLWANFASQGRTVFVEGRYKLIR